MICNGEKHEFFECDLAARGPRVFLYGITLMGDGLNLVAGNRLESVLFRLTSSRVRGILLGTLVTAVVQSSSAVSVMCVG